jgi:hypothetical protein
MTPAEFRVAALSLPGARENAHHGHPDFRVGRRIFATLGWPDQDWGVVKLTTEEQQLRVAAQPDIFKPVPGAWGRDGNTQVRLATVDELTLKSALLAAWRRVAPKKRAAAGG